MQTIKKIVDQLNSVKFSIYAMEDHFEPNGRPARLRHMALLHQRKELEEQLQAELIANNAITTDEQIAMVRAAADAA